ncbi:MAG: hypothetical protein KKI09_06455 [Spirochaetes bacterium]|nr:hypothetical protein [Spirochaetota bacterium]MBU0955053.1 hypothetical protein [Spirochaetota bacterium]
MNGFIDDKLIDHTVTRICEEKNTDLRHEALEGVRCVAGLWQASDGDSQDFTDFCVLHFAATEEDRAELFSRLEAVSEKLYGSALAVSVQLQWAVHVDQGKLLPVDDILSAWSPDAHLGDDLFANKLAFVIHLNFPYRPLELKLHDGGSWSRQSWAEARLGDMLNERAPASVLQDLSAAYAAAQSYITSYNVYPAALLDEGAATDFPADKRLLMHWNMRDEIKAQYAQPGGLRRQQLLAKVMERVVDGSIPLAAVDNPAHSWDPFAPCAGHEADRRYEHLHAIFKAQRGYDLWSPENPTHIARRFNVHREIPEKEVEHLFHELLGAPQLSATAKLLSSQLGRPLEAFDIWYRSFDQSSKPDEQSLDQLCRQRYPDARAYKADIPRILQVLGFDADTARWLSERIEVDQARGSGHAMPAAMRSEHVRLRTRVPSGGMDYKGFNIACHELGHNVEQVFSLHGIDQYFLAGVPNTAFTEAFAFVFQARDLLILGVDSVAREHNPLTAYWETCEIAAVALVDMEVWRWLYANPEAGSTELRQAVIDISRSVWNRWFAPAFGIKNSLLLGSYSHMIDSAMYLPDYPLGHIIAFQIEAAMKGQSVGDRMGSMCRLGRLAPGHWMQQALGTGLSVKPMLDAAAALAGR